MARCIQSLPYRNFPFIAHQSARRILQLCQWTVRRGSGSDFQIFLEIDRGSLNDTGESFQVLSPRELRQSHSPQYAHDARAGRRVHLLHATYVGVVQGRGGRRTGWGLRSARRAHYMIAAGASENPSNGVSKPREQKAEE